jgi:hypothetical protein
MADILDNLGRDELIRLPVEERLERCENVIKMFMGYMRGRRSMQEVEEVMAAAMALGGTVVEHDTGFPVKLPHVSPTTDKTPLQQQEALLKEEEVVKEDEDEADDDNDDIPF